MVGEQSFDRNVPCPKEQETPLTISLFAKPTLEFSISMTSIEELHSVHFPSDDIKSMFIL